MFKKPPGIEDVFPDRLSEWNFILNNAREVFKNFNYKEIIIPIFEYTEVFARGLGGETDVVSKEMFTFKDRGDRDLALRPEGTASVVRAYIENGEYNRLSTCKFFYTGPMFRAEKPQRGRLRQFNQFGAEFFGSPDPYYDYEIISIMNLIIKRVGIKNHSLLINSIGCPKCRPAYIEILKNYYTSKIKDLCGDCSRRLEKNPLRLLDCKNASCNEIKKETPVITGYLCDKCNEHYSRLKSYLIDSHISFNQDPYLVRGLDYYTRTTFEFVSTALGSQSAFAAGGRYDHLVEYFGGKETPAVGFAAGIERMMLLLGDDNRSAKDILDTYIIHSGNETLEKAVSLCALLRENNISADIDPMSKNFKPQFKKADREKARLAVIIGEEEFSEKRYTIKDMGTGEQEKINKEDLIAIIQSKIK